MGGQAQETPFSSLTGKSQSQSQSGNQVSRTLLDQAQQDQINLQTQNLIRQTQAAQGLGQTLQQQAAGAGVPQLQRNVEIQRFNPQFSTSLDAMSRGLVSQGTQALNQQAATQRRALASQFGGQPGIAQALGRQATMQSRLQANPLLLGAAQQQASRELGQQGLIGQAAQQNTAANLAQQQQQNQAAIQQQGLGEQSRREQFGYGTAGLQAQQALMPILSALAQQQGTQVTQSQQEAKSRSGGLLGNFGLK